MQKKFAHCPPLRKLPSFKSKSMIKYALPLFMLFTLVSCSSPNEAVAERHFVSPVVVGEQLSPGFQIFLVRHAEKASDGTKDPDLNQSGLARAKRLANHLESAGITKIYSTDYKRTRQTAAPLAALKGIEVEIYKTDLEDISNLLKDHKVGNVLVVGHSNTTPKLMNKVLKEERFESLDEKDYDNLFVLSVFGEDMTTTILKF